MSAHRTPQPRRHLTVDPVYLVGAQAIHAEAGPIKKDVEVQMEKELNHVHRREIDRSVEVLHFVGGEDSLRRVLWLWRPQHRAHQHETRSSDGRAVLDVFQCLMSRMGRGGGQTHRSLY